MHISDVSFMHSWDGPPGGLASPSSIPAWRTLWAARPPTAAQSRPRLSGEVILLPALREGPSLLFPGRALLSRFAQMQNAAPGSCLSSSLPSSLSRGVGAVRIDGVLRRLLQPDFSGIVRSAVTFDLRYWFTLYLTSPVGIQVNAYIHCTEEWQPVT